VSDSEVSPRISGEIHSESMACCTGWTQAFSLVGDQGVHSASLIPFIGRPNRLKEDRPCMQSAIKKVSAGIWCQTTFSKAENVV
jgi:hypothetical protein